MLLGGRDVEVSYTLDRAAKPRVSFDGRKVLIKAGRPRDVFPLLYGWTRKKASLLIRQSVWRHSRIMKLETKRIAIRDQRTRWGSCSNEGNLNFSFRIAMAPPSVMDYVIVHELAHIKYKNHSREFWTEVEKYCPDYREHQKWLHRNARLLRLPAPTDIR